MLHSDLPHLAWLPLNIAWLLFKPVWHPGQGITVFCSPFCPLWLEKHYKVMYQNSLSHNDYTHFNSDCCAKTKVVLCLLQNSSEISFTQFTHNDFESFDFCFFPDLLKCTYYSMYSWICGSQHIFNLKEHFCFYTDKSRKCKHSLLFVFLVNLIL